MTFAASVHAGEDRIHGAHPSVTSNAPLRNAIADAQAAVSVCRQLERTDDGCPFKAGVTPSRIAREFGISQIRRFRDTSADRYPIENRNKQFLVSRESCY